MTTSTGWSAPPARPPPPHAAENPGKQQVRPAVQRILDQMPMPAYLRNGRFDVLAANELGRALYSPLYEQADAGGSPNSARFLFLDPAASEFFVDYDKVLNDCVAFLRAEAGRDPYDKDLSDLSASSPPAARTSAAAGRPTTSATTAPDASASTTRSSATSSSTSRPSSSPETPASASTSTPRLPTPPPSTPSTCSPAGPCATRQHHHPPRTRKRWNS